jgi:ribosomal protein S18 acetylase RimI-like enzyme
MTEDEVAAFVDAQRDPYIAERVVAGERPDEARRIADEQMARLFPGGTPAPGQLLYRVLAADGSAVGALWIGPHIAERPDAFWVWDIEIDEAERGRGLGRAAMGLAEEEARAHGASELGLNVFGSNTVARTLYESIGYRATAITMRKSL